MNIFVSEALYVFSPSITPYVHDKRTVALTLMFQSELVTDPYKIQGDTEKNSSEENAPN